MSKRILVVEDQPVSRQIIRLLVPADYERCGAAFLVWPSTPSTQFGTPYRDCVSARARGNTEILEPRERPQRRGGTHAIVTLLVTGTGGFSKAFSSPASVGVSVRQAETV